MYGIENLKKIVLFALGLTAQIAKAMEDGKFAWTESFGFVDELIQIPGVVKSFPAVKQEVADLDEAERKELYDFIVANFDLPNDKLEATIEHSLAFTIAAAALYEQWRDLKK